MIQIIVVLCILIFLLVVLHILQQKMINDAFAAIEIQQEINRDFNSIIGKIVEILKERTDNGQDV